MAEGHFTPEMQPNSQHQMWSRWIVGWEVEFNRLCPVREVRMNVRRYFAAGFGTIGRFRVTKPNLWAYEVEVEVEGPPAHDPEYRERVKRQFIEHFLFRGFGLSARLVRFEVKVLAGDQEDGRPPDQMIVIPPIRFADGEE